MSSLWQHQSPHLILPTNGLSLFPDISFPRLAYSLRLLLLPLSPADRILVTVGRQSLYISKTPEMIKYQHFYTQIQALPFGITFYGTRSFITFAAIFKVTSLVGSVLVFLLGWSASK
jgi:hypothetical protein